MFGFEDFKFVGQVKGLTNLTEEIVIKAVYPYLLISLVLFPCEMFLSIPCTTVGYFLFIFYVNIISKYKLTKIGIKICKS